MVKMVNIMLYILYHNEKMCKKSELASKEELLNVG